MENTKKNHEINNIANTTGRATYKQTPTKVCPDMEQLYFELEDQEHVFQVGLKTLLECILFGAKEKQLTLLVFLFNLFQHLHFFCCQFIVF